MAGNWGSSFFVIPERARNKGEAWELIKFLCLDSRSQVSGFKIADVFPAYIPAWQDRIFDESMSFFKGQKARKLWYEIALQIPETNTHKYDPIANKVLGEAVKAVLDDGKDVDAVLNEAKVKVEEQVATKK